MTLKKIATRLILLLSFASADAQSQIPANVKSVTIVMPIYHQLFAFMQPTEFDLNPHPQQNASFFLREAVLRGETVEHWTQMITLSGLRGAASKGVTAKLQTDSLAQRFRKSCPETFAYKNIGSMQIARAPSYLVLISCGSVADAGGQPGAMHSETALVVAMQGDQDMYTLQWAERGASSPKPLVPDDAKWVARFHTLTPIHVCAEIGRKGTLPKLPGQIERQPWGVFLGDAFDFDQRILGQGGDLDGRASRRDNAHRGEVLCVNLVHGGEIGHALEENGRFDDVAQVDAGLGENGFQVFKNLPGLLLDAAGDEVACLGIGRYLAGGEEHVADANGLRVGADGGGCGAGVEMAVLVCIIPLYKPERGRRRRVEEVAARGIGGIAAQFFPGIALDEDILAWCLSAETAIPLPGSPQTQVLQSFA